MDIMKAHKKYWIIVVRYNELSLMHTQFTCNLNSKYSWDLNEGLHERHQLLRSLFDAITRLGGP